MTRIGLLCAALALSLGVTAGGSAQETMRIAAVVNDQVISVFDVQSRITLMMSAIGAPDTPETRREMAIPVLRSLIDESLQIQEANANGIRLSQAELADALASIAQQNNVPLDQIDDYLRQAGIPKTALVGQIRSQLVWNKFVNQRLRPTINIGQEDVEDEMARLEANAGKPEYLLAEIDLYVDNPLDEPQILRQANQLVDQIRGGARFSSIAQQFSQGSMAATGGDLGWVVESQLRPEIAQSIEQIEIGTISDPIRSVEGFHIIFVRERRQVMMDDDSDVRVRVVQILLPVSENGGAGEKQTQTLLAETISDTVVGCVDMNNVVEELNSSMSGDIGWLRMGDMPGNFREALRDMKVGYPTAPIETDGGILVLMICERDDPKENLDRRDEVMLRLQQERLDLISRQKIRDLRRAAFVDIRA